MLFSCYGFLKKLQSDKRSQGLDIARTIGMLNQHWKDKNAAILEAEVRKNLNIYPVNFVPKN